MSWSSIDATVAYIVPICIPLLKLLTDHYTLRKFIPFVYHCLTRRFFQIFDLVLFFTIFMLYPLRPGSLVFICSVRLRFWEQYFLGAAPPSTSLLCRRAAFPNPAMRGLGDLFKLPSGVRARCPGRWRHWCIFRAYPSLLCMFTIKVFLTVRRCPATSWTVTSWTDNSWTVYCKKAGSRPAFG